MQPSFRRPSLRAGLAVVLPLALAVACDNQITEVPRPLAPSGAPLAGKAPFKSVFELNPIIGSGQSSFALSISDLGQVVGNSGGYATIWDNSVIGQNLGFLAGGTSNVASAISRDGSEIVGFADDGTTSHPVRWLKLYGVWTADRLTEYFTGGCSPSAVSSDGTAIAGNCNGTAVVWLNGRLIVLGTGYVYGANRNGQAVGSTAGGDHAFLWNFMASPVTLTDLGTLGGGFAFAYAINDAGQVTGWAENAAHESHTFLWSPRKSVMVDIGTAGTTTGGYGINESGQVVGFVYVNSIPHAAFFDAGKVVDLGVLPGYDSAVATGINSNGQVVGYSNIYPSFSQSRGTEWLLR